MAPFGEAPNGAFVFSERGCVGSADGMPLHACTRQPRGERGMVQDPDATRDSGGELLRWSCSRSGGSGGFAPTFQGPGIQDHHPGAFQPDGAVPLQGLERALDHLAPEPVIERVMCLGFMTAQAHTRFWFAVTWVLGDPPGRGGPDRGGPVDPPLRRNGGGARLSFSDIGLPESGGAVRPVIDAACPADLPPRSSDLIASESGDGSDVFE